MADELELGDTYSVTIGRIKAQHGDKSRLGMVALMWISLQNGRCKRMSSATPQQSSLAPPISILTTSLRHWLPAVKGLLPWIRRHPLCG